MHQTSIHCKVGLLVRQREKGLYRDMRIKLVGNNSDGISNVIKITTDQKQKKAVNIAGDSEKIIRKPASLIAYLIAWKDESRVDENMQQPVSLHQTHWWCYRITYS